MKPILYAPNETDFTSQGLGVLSDCISCVVEQELSRGTNGVYELTIKYPYDGIHYTDIAQFSIIKVIPYDNGQFQYFRVYKITEPMNGVCTINAEHISYQLNYLPVEPFTASSLVEAMAQLNSNTVLPSPFTIRSDFTAYGELSFESQTNARAILGGGNGSILSVYGGEIEWDNYTVYIKQRVGLVRDVELRYGKNITDIKQERNIQKLYTGISPYWKGDHISDDGKDPIAQKLVMLNDQKREAQTKVYRQEAMVEQKEEEWRDAQETYGKGTKKAKKAHAAYKDAKEWLDAFQAELDRISAEVTKTLEELNSVQPIITETTVTLPEKIIYADNYEDFPYQRIRSLDFSQYFDSEPTADQLRDAANTWLLENPIGRPEVNIKVNFIPLWGTEEYKDIAPLERVYLGDTITVNFEKLGISETARVVAYKYDVLMERYNELEIGDKESSLSSSIADGNLVVAEITDDVKDYPSWIQSEIERNSEMIKGGYGGYVVFGNNAAGQPEEIFIMDTPDIATATSVVRMNRNGIGFSMTGFEGPYNTAWTIDGHFDASYITAGTLNAVRIRTGILSDALNTPKNYWNLDTGEFRLSATGVSVDGTALGQYVEGKVDSEWTQEKVFNTLTNNGAIQGIFMENGKLYINGSYIKSGDIEGINIYNGSGRDGWVQLVNGELWFSQTKGGTTTGLIMSGVDGGKSFLSLGSSKVLIGNDTFDVNTTTIRGVTFGASVVDFGSKMVKMPQVLNSTASSSRANIHINESTGELRFIKAPSSSSTTSSKRFKHDISDLTDGTLDPHRLYELPVVQFIYNDDYIKNKNDDRYHKLLAGFIAETVEEIYPSAAAYDEGKLDGWYADRILPPMLKLIQEQHEEIESLKSQTAALDERLTKLEGANNG